MNIMEPNLQCWISELADLGYTPDLPRPCNIGIQAALASICAPAVHQAIIDHEREALYRPDGVEPGPLFMLLLGIEEWFSVYLLAETVGTNAALTKLNAFAAYLPGWDNEDNFALECAQSSEIEILAALLHVERVNHKRRIGLAPQGRFDAPGLSSASSSISSPTVSISNLNNDAVSPLDICSQSSGNPLWRLRWATPESHDGALASESPTSVTDLAPDVSEYTGEPFIPNLPPRHIEWEVSRFDNSLWRISNINNLAPMSQTMWMAMAGISSAELAECHRNAMQGVTRCNKSPVYILRWSLPTFGPKYKCLKAVTAKIRGPLETNDKRVDDHKSKLWNWLRPFFCCKCYFTAAGACHGQLLWFDHVVWFIMNHLESFFDGDTIQARFIQMMQWIGKDVRKMVLDHISFLIIRQLMLEGARELVKHPMEPFFAQRETSFALRTIECLLKPVQFTLDMERTAPAGPRAIVLDRTTGNAAKGKYASPGHNLPNTGGFCGRSNHKGGRGRGDVIKSIQTRSVAGHARQLAVNHPRTIGAPITPMGNPGTGRAKVDNIGALGRTTTGPPVIINVTTAPSSLSLDNPHWLHLSPLPRQNLAKKFQ